eukprot:TRINITY_DN16925_c0_g1_i1.p2 TRINITY_DN16925_c0_g1~~TRINITY_DN16925_c0_g1_i1.p2  ORF type:complete len:238 (+),score=55.43 TRINITY_DN16925_c0_g1_i1:67-780(+)
MAHRPAGHGDGALLMCAAALGQAERIVLLAQSSSSALISTERDRLGLTALHKAARGGHLNATRALLRAGADVDARDHQGRTPLHLCASCSCRKSSSDSISTFGQPRKDCSHGAVAQLLLGSGADGAARSDCRATPLHGAARYGHAEVAVVLLCHGVPTGLRDAKGCTAADIASDCTQPMLEPRERVRHYIQMHASWREGLRSFGTWQQRLRDTGSEPCVLPAEIFPLVAANVAAPAH